jgi:hypothetical protein
MRARIVVIVLLCAFALAIAACQFTPEDQELVRSFVEDWARSKNLHPIKEDGGLSWSGIWNAGTRYVTGSTGDPEADAVLDAYEMIKNLNEADKLMDAGRVNRNAAAMDQAIQKRPGDWTYRVARSALAIEQGDLTTYEAQGQAAFSIVDQRDIDPLWYANENIRELQGVHDKLAAQGWPNAEQCAALNTALAVNYQRRAELTGSEADATAAQIAASLATSCAQ